jgi:hypothetical protein
LIEVNAEQLKIGENLFDRMKIEHEKISKMEKFQKENQISGNLDKNSFRTTKTSIIDNLLLIRNTSNLSHMMNKNSILKNSLIQNDAIDEIDLINMVSNIDLKFLEQAYSIYKKVDFDTKFIEHFRNFRYSEIAGKLKLNEYNKKIKEGKGRSIRKKKSKLFEEIREDRFEEEDEDEDKKEDWQKEIKRAKIEFNINPRARNNNTKTENTFKNTLKDYDDYFTNILGFIIVQISVFELLPIFYTKRKFEDLMNFIIRELQENISVISNKIV